MSIRTMLPYTLQRHMLPPPPYKEGVQSKLVRRMHPKAARGWAQLYDEIARSPAGRPPYEELCVKESRHIFWAIDCIAHENILGMMVCTPIRILGLRIGVIHDIIVAQQYRHRGIATEILDGIIAWTRQEAHANGTPGIEMLQTAAPLQLVPVTSFLGKHGFRRTTGGVVPYYELDIAPNDAYRLAPAPR